MTNKLNTINFSTPFLIGVSNSQVSPAWIRLLGAVVADLQQQPLDPQTLQDLEEFVYTDRTPEDQAARIAGIESQVLNQSRVPSGYAPVSSEVSALLVPPRKTIPTSIPDDLLGMSRSKTAGTANTVSVMDDSATNQTMYPVWSNGISGACRVRTAGAKWTFNPSTGRATSTQLVATAGFGCNGAGPQTAFVSGGAAPAGGTGTAAGGWDTAAHRDAAILLLNNIRSALVANGIMS